MYCSSRLTRDISSILWNELLKFSFFLVSFNLKEILKYRWEYENVYAFCKKFLFKRSPISWNIVSRMDVF